MEYSQETMDPLIETFHLASKMRQKYEATKAHPLTLDDLRKLREDANAILSEIHSFKTLIAQRPMVGEPWIDDTEVSLPKDFTKKDVKIYEIDGVLNNSTVMVKGLETPQPAWWSEKFTVWLRGPGRGDDPVRELISNWRACSNVMSEAEGDGPYRDTLRKCARELEDVLKRK